MRVASEPYNFCIKVFIDTPCSLSLYSSTQRMLRYMFMCSEMFEIWKSFSKELPVDFSGLYLMSIAYVCSLCY